MVHKRAAIILAAGKSSRMKSSLSKVLHCVGGQSMLAWSASMARAANVSRAICVAGSDNDDVKEAAENLGLDVAIQKKQLGTANAVMAAKDILGDFSGSIMVLYADTPLIQIETLEKVFNSLEGEASAAVLGFDARQPNSYGRLVTEGDKLIEIVEAKEASPDQLSISLCNSGIIAFSSEEFDETLKKINNENSKGEYYLTDLIKIMCKEGKVSTFVMAPEHEVLGVNSRKDLALAEKSFQTKMRNNAMESGVTLRDPSSVYFSYDTIIERDVDIASNVVFGLGVKISRGAIIHPFCDIQGSFISKGSKVGPFARLRQGSFLGENAKVGNFVETKNAQISKGTKVNHLSYIGDAEIGENCNIGAGTITCNYDGYKKHKTIIGKNVFVGTNSSLVAPIKIGDQAFLGSGGVITEDVPPGSLALARAKQINKIDWAYRFRAAQIKRKKSE